MKYFVISLKSTPHRLDKFFENNTHIENVQVFDAIEGAQVSRELLIKNNIIVSNSFYKDAAIGCALSHISLWNYAYKNNECITIFEDDVRTHKDFTSKSSSLLNSLNYEWDFVAWGWNFDADLYVSLQNNLSPCRMVFSELALRQNCDEFLADSSLNNILMQLFASNGIMSYSISPKGAAKFLKGCLPLGQLVTINMNNIWTMAINPDGIDCSMPSVYQATASLVCFPPLAISDNDKKFSTINKSIG